MFHNPSLMAREQMKLVLGFEVGDLFAGLRLGYMQSVPKRAGSSALRPRQ
jgi:hypothetical protein